MIAARDFGVRDRAAKCVRAEDDVSVGEENPVALGRRCTLPHRMSFSQPSGRKLVDVDHVQFAPKLPLQLIHDASRRITRAIVEGADFDLGIVLRQKRTQAVLDFGSFVSRGYDY